MIDTKKWFTAENLTELKKQYRELIWIHHPDRGGIESDMMQINNEYDILCQRLPEINKDGETYEPTTRATGEAFRQVINTIITLEGITIEICGCWIWISGDTKPYKDIFKACGCRWQPKKTCWAWAEKKSKHYSKKSYSMDDIRGMYGSEEIKTKTTTKL